MSQIDTVLRQTAISHYQSLGFQFNEQSDSLLFLFFNVHNDFISYSTNYPGNLIDKGRLPVHYFVIHQVGGDGPFGEDINREEKIIELLEGKMGL